MKSKPTLKRRLERSEAQALRLKEALIRIHTHVFADLPEITAPPRNRLQYIAAQCQLAVPALLRLKARPEAQPPLSKPCTNCNGRGLHEKRRPIAFGESRNTWCRACGGKGTKAVKPVSRGSHL